MGERFVRNEEVTGSIPVSSTTRSPPTSPTRSLLARRPWCRLLLRQPLAGGPYRRSIWRRGLAHGPSLLLLWGVTLWLYLPTLGYRFVWDDHLLVVDSTVIRAPGLRGLWFLLTHGLGEVRLSAYYRPLQSLTYWLDWRLWHLRPLGYHLTNLLWHGLDTTLVYALLHRWTRHQRASLAAALLYALHPIHTATVAYIAGRADLLMVAGLLGMMLAALRGAGGVAALCFAAALGAKELAVVGLPLTIILNALVPSGRARWRLLAPCLVVLAFYALIHAHVILEPRAWENAVASWRTLAWGLPWIMATDLQLLLLPRPSQLLHRFPVVGGQVAPDWLWGLVVCGLAGAGARWLWRHHPAARPPLAWLGISLVATWPLYVSVATPVSEHWLILPLIGLCGLVALGFARWLRDASKDFLPGWLLLLPVALALATITRTSMAVWQNDVTLYAHVTRWTPPKAKVFANYAEALSEAQQEATAMEVAAQAITLDPREDAGWIQLGSSSLHQQNLPQAQWAAEEAVARQGPFRTVAYQLLGYTLWHRQRLREAEAAFLHAVQIDETNVDAWIPLGGVYGDQGRWAEALRAWETAVRLRPDLPKSYLQVAVAERALGHPERAAAYERMADRLVQHLKRR